MPGPELAQYGIATFAVAGLIYVVSKIFDRFFDKKDSKNITEVIKNNTKALEQVTEVVRAIQLGLTRQEAKIDELLERARK